MSAERRDAGPRGRLARCVDHLAVRRTLRLLIARTNNVHIVKWLGKPILQHPMDAWVMQEVIADLRPDVIVETGTYMGGSAYFFACLCDLLGHGEVMSVDIRPQGTIGHPRTTYLRGSSVDPTIIAHVRERLQSVGATRVLVVLDSDHSAAHVRRELEAYAPLVPVGSYVHLQDGIVDQLPDFRHIRPGPLVAATAFLENHPEFVRDTGVEARYVMTYHPCGWLKRVRPG